MKTCPICENNAVDENVSVCPICKFNDFRPIIVSDEEYEYWLGTSVNPARMKWTFEQNERRLKAELLQNEIRLKAELSQKEKEINTLKEQLKKQTALYVQTLSKLAPLPSSHPKIGSIIKFGSYDWRVLDVQNNAALIITEEIIEKKAYHGNRTAITWANCDLRKYLNGEFINNVKKFSPNDKARIIPVTNENADNQWYNTDGGSNTTDSIFLLSLNELVRYFGDSGDLRSKKRYGYDVKMKKFVQNANGHMLCDMYGSARVANYLREKGHTWRLRSPGDGSDDAAYVGYDGGVQVAGYPVDDDASLGGVRPALWLKL
ncbi:MAG: DUF6273 domain-containing protein [Oscillospiraceae bacterium]|nr:DUF6273 domain-containing protein [Oscillospiraceae bacterium]